MGQGGNGLPRVGVAELDQRLRAGERLLVLDVRPREAWSGDTVRIPGATWLPLDEVPQRARDLPRGRPLVVYCS